MGGEIKGTVSPGGGGMEFDLGSAVGGAAGGLFSMGGQLLAAHMQNEANKKMNADNLRLAYIQRGDTLGQQATENKFGEMDRAYRDRMAEYQKGQDARAAMRQRLQDDAAYRNNILAMINAGRGRGI